jgi:hypothetical protein
MANNPKRIFLPFLVLFLFFNGIFLSCKVPLHKYGLDYYVLIVANTLFLLTTIAVLLYQRKALDNKNPNVFVRSVMGGMMIKMFISIIALIVYRLISKDGFSKMSIFAAMFLYLIYLSLDVFVLTKLAKNKNG